MKREALYHADTNELEELPQMEKPKKPRRLNYDLAGALYSACLIKYEADLAGYNGHLASLRRLPCSPQPGFKDGHRYVEGKDYEVKKHCEHKDNTMAKRVTNFELETIVGLDTITAPKCGIQIIGQTPEHTPYVSIGIREEYFFIKDRDLERFAVNILKALNSKKLKQ